MNLQLVKQDDLRKQVFHLRKSGADFIDIAEQMGVPSAEVIRHYRDYIKELATFYSPDDREAMIHLELARLDDLQHIASAELSTEPLKAIDAILKIMTHRAKLMQLDALDPRDAKNLTQILVVGEDRAGFIEALQAGRRKDDKGDQEEAR